MGKDKMIRREGVQLSLFRGEPSPMPPALRTVGGNREPAAGAFQLSCEQTWTEREMAAWAPPESLSVSECAVEHRMLSTKNAAAPGQWTHLSYYTVEVMDAFTDPFVEQITVMASVQSSKTESIYNMIGYAIIQDPGPALVVMPSAKVLRKVNRRIEQMIRESPEMAKHITADPDDITRDEIRLDNMTIYFVTAGSSIDLRNIEARYIFCDETDEYVPIPGQGSPVEMAEARSTTFWNRKILHTCTPTVETGYINVEFEKSDQSRYWVPCPNCKGYQILDFWRIKHKGEVLGKWPKDKRDPDYIRTNRVARYECVHCGAEIDDRDKRWMLRLGTWVPEGHPIEKDGSVAIPRPRAMHRGFNWSACYSPWRSFSDVAAKYFQGKDNTEEYKTFVNLWLANAWKEMAQKRESSEILALRTETPALIVPSWALALTMGIDHQKVGFWAVVRAWNRDLTSHLVRQGFIETWEELEKWLFTDVYPVEGSDMVLPIWRAGIDIGGTETEPEEATMTEEVYAWLRRSGRGVVFGVKGASKGVGSGKKMKASVIDKMPGKGGRPIPGGIRLWIVDTGLIKDAIWSRIEAGKFQLNSDVDETYAKQLTAEAKERDKQGKFTWQVQGRKANHLLDAEMMAAAMADPECNGGVVVLKRAYGMPGTTGAGSVSNQGQQQVARSEYVKKMLGGR